MYKKSTQVPNLILDHYLKHLSAAELKILLVIIRQTYGWIDKRTGGRKTRDRISFAQFMEKTGYSRRMLSKAIQSLMAKGVITITNCRNQILNSTTSRRGKSLYYTYQHVHFLTPTSALSRHQLVHQSAYNKTRRLLGLKSSIMLKGFQRLSKNQAMSFFVTLYFTRAGVNLKNSPFENIEDYWVICQFADLPV